MSVAYSKSILGMPYKLRFSYSFLREYKFKLNSTRQILKNSYLKVGYLLFLRIYYTFDNGLVIASS